LAGTSADPVCARNFSREPAGLRLALPRSKGQPTGGSHLRLEVLAYKEDATL